MISLEKIDALLTQRTPRLARFGRSAVGNASVAVWHLKGRAGPPPSRLKRRIIRRFGALYDTRVLVETGTFRGGTVDALRRSFGHVFSIELSDFYYDQATQKFKDVPNVTIIQGDSGDVLAGLVATLDAPAMFWLDAHWSGGKTAQSTIDSPVSSELSALLASDIPHVILIDDARLFDGTDGYPSLNDLRTEVALGRIHRDVVVESDIIRLTPA